MKTKLLEQLESVLKTIPHYWNDEELLRTRVVEDLNSNNEELIEALLSNDYIKEKYTQVVGGVTLFNKDELKRLLSYKGYWHDSYTKYSNSIGLTSDGKFLEYNSDVVLDFPFKDCVLEGGMTQEDVGKEEVYFNEVIARDEIDTLLAPKVFTNSKRYSEGGVEENITEIKESDNLIIKGNNLLALHSLKERYAGKVKLIYIDPPYNTGNDDFKYNDRYNHSTWLTFVKSRLEIAKDLLSDDGTIWISIDDDEQAYLKVLCDSIFGRENFINNIIWEKRYSPTNDSRWLSDSHDFVVLYAKNKNQWAPNLLPRTEKQNQYYRYDDNDGRGRWRSDNVLVKSFSQSGVFPIINPNTGEEHWPPKGSCYRFNEETARRMVAENRLYFGVDGTGRPQLKRYLSEVRQGVTPMTLWFREDVTDNQQAKKEINDFKFDLRFDTPKPEALIQRIIHLGSNENDIVLDFFMGSGTTQAVAHKMKRQYIGIEQMDYINEVSVPRLQKVIEGEQGGISKEVEWQGGGSFIYTELKELNQTYIKMIQGAQDSDELLSIFATLKDDSSFGYSNAYFDFKADIDKLAKDLYEVDGLPRKQAFQELELHDQKRLLIGTLDKNQLYVNYAEMNDASYQVSEADKAFTHSFYGKDEA